MNRLRWLLPLAVSLAALWWVGWKGLAVLLTVVCGLAGVAYYISTRRAMPPPGADGRGDTRDVERDIPPRSG
jgi:putative exporter of polyketide antibiotics